MIIESKQNTFNLNGKHIQTIKWENLKNTDEGNIEQVIQFDKLSVQVFGIFGESSSIILEGSNDRENFYTLTDSSGSSLYFTKAGLKSVNETVVCIRPKVINGDDSTSLTLLIAAKG